jgi:hypothetical protein
MSFRNANIDYVRDEEIALVTFRDSNADALLLQPSNEGDNLTPSEQQFSPD